MDTSAESFADTEASVSETSHSGGTATEEQGPLTRRTALRGGASALLAAATVIVGGGATAGEAAAASTSSSSDSSSSSSSSSGSSKKSKLVLNVNGKNHVIKSSPDTMLLYVLRDELHLRGPKFGCGLSECGACAVLSDGKQIRSCITPVSLVAGKNDIVTLDGLADQWRTTKKIKSKTVLHPLQQAWIDEQVPQCGYCQSGMIMQATELLSKKKNPTTAEIKHAMNGHLCRCGTYNSIIRAIHRAAGEMAK
jgi:aerobic-type carbon monoxide dehydrogenase small subunit (CoxS/CutS family)